MILIGLIDYFRLVFHRKFYSENMNRRYQKKQLKKIYKYAINYSPFYQELYKDLPFNSMDDFNRLPTINKTMMMENFTTLNTCGINKEDVLEYAIKMENDKTFLGYYQDKYVVGLSSGTSGNKGIYITPKEVTKRLPAVFLARGGFPLKLLPYRILFMLRVFSQGFEDINSKVVSLNYLSTMEDIHIVIKRMNDLKINILMAPPSFIRELLPYKDEITISIKRIMTYAEVLEEEDKNRFEQDFNTNVIEIYQASEGQIASACKHGHLHINEDLVYVELYDEEGNVITKPNVVGHKMVLTNLVNLAQPLIRYEMNDMIILDEPCTCGSKFRRIKKILGRHDDLLYFYNKKQEKKYIFPDLFVRWIIVVSNDIREFQVFQKEVNKIRIIIELIHDDNPNIKKDLYHEISNKLLQFGIENPTIEITFAKIELPKDKNKFKRFINEIE